jgi:hypothetical protein
MPKAQTGKRTKKKTAFIGVKVPVEHAQQLKTWAKSLDLTVSHLLRRIVRERFSEAEAVTTE